MVFLSCYALTMVETQEFDVNICLKTHVLKWDLGTRSAFLPHSKCAYLTKMEKTNENLKNVSDCVSESKLSFHKNDCPSSR